MTKLRKQRRRKVYRHNINRKRLRNKIENVGKISCKEVKDAWERKKSIKANFQDMGLSFDPNRTIKIPKEEMQIKVSVTSNENDEWQEAQIESANIPQKAYVVEALEQDARAPRVKLFRLPKAQVEWITYLMDKYGNDYKAMERDKKNYYQETWKQLRAKIKRFKSIPEQYSKYLAAKGCTEEVEEDDTKDDSD